MELAMSHPLVGKEEADHSFVDEDAIVVQVECGAPLLERVGSEDDLVRESRRNDEVVRNPGLVDLKM